MITVRNTNDADLEQIAKIKSLRFLDLMKTKVKGQGFVHFDGIERKLLVNLTWSHRLLCMDCIDRFNRDNPNLRIQRKNRPEP